MISDLDSLNSTAVNGVPVREHTLEHGDRVALGDLLFLFLLHDEEMSSISNLAHLDEGELVARSTVQFQLEGTPYQQWEKLQAVVPRMARDLSVLLKISTTINSIRDPDTLQRQLLELIFEVVPAERGAILLAEEGAQDFTSVFGWHRSSHADQPILVSRTVAYQVLRQRVAILSNDVVGSGEFEATSSLASGNVTSLLCVPLILFDHVLGVIYLDASSPAQPFEHDHLQLLNVIADIAAVALQNARHMERLESENQQLRADIQIEHDMVGESPRLRSVYQVISKVASSDSTVLLRGESGTGKELAARAIHVNSPRARQPFVAINCAALTETLLESELFGHEKGAFTGAVAQKKGKLEVAEGGTLFMDEVGEIAPALQSKLLRVLQERVFERVGGTRSIKADVRFVAATNKDLEAAIKSGDFRQDLYYRLNVVSLTMPSLRERREDIPLLANYFVAKCSGKSKRKVTGISAQARACLMNYDWPGNVRELENAIERAVVLGSTELILPEDLPEALLETESPADAPPAKYLDAIKEMKKQLILQAVEQADGSYTGAAKLLGVHPNYLHRLIRNMNLKGALNK